MPSNSTEYIRNYMRKNKTKKTLAENAQRKRARYHAEKAGRVRPFDGKEVDHKKGLKAGNGKKNLRVISRTANRKKGVLVAIKTRKARSARGGKY